MASLRIAQLSLLAALVWPVSGCGVDASPYTLNESRAQTINRALRPYFEEFVRLRGQATAEISLHLGDLEKGTAGKCFVPGGKSGGDQIADTVFGDSTQKERRILINARFYDRNKDNRDAIENVVFHELGHCILNRGHSEKKIADQYGQEIPESIMYPSEFGHYPFYRENYVHYIKELFNPKPGSATVDGRGTQSTRETRLEGAAPADSADESLSGDSATLY